MLVSSGGAQNCASKLRVTILLRDPLTIPDSTAHLTEAGAAVHNLQTQAGVGKAAGEDLKTGRV